MRAVTGSAIEGVLDKEDISNRNLVRYAEDGDLRTCNTRQYVHFMQANKQRR